MRISDWSFRRVLFRSLHLDEVAGRHDRGDDLALPGVAGRVHADEARPVHVLRLIFHLYAAEFGRGRKDGVVDLDLHDVLVAGHRTVGPVGAPGAVLHRILVAQTREEGAPGVVPIALWVADGDAVERESGRAHV